MPIFCGKEALCFSAMEKKGRMTARDATFLGLALCGLLGLSIFLMGYGFVGMVRSDALGRSFLYIGAFLLFIDLWVYYKLFRGWKKSIGAR